jgi:hypothetical protein
VTPIESLAAWRIHMAAQRSASAKGACWRCAIEAGCRATDGPGERRWVEMHLECAKKAGTHV